jgi:hypothetical protein
MSYQGPMLIREPELPVADRCPGRIAAALIALLAGVLYYVAMTQPYVNL